MKTFFSALFLMSSLSVFGQVHGESNSFEGNYDRDFSVGYDFKLNEKGQCEKIIKENQGKFRVPKISKKVIDINNCKTDLIAQKTREILGGDCTPSSKSSFLGDYKNSFFGRATQERIVQRLSGNCVCELTHSKRIWVSNAENVFFHPLTSLFDGPTTKDESIFSLLERDACIDLAKNSEEAEAIKEAYDSFQ